MIDSIPINRELRIQTVPRVAQRTQVTYELDFGVRLSGEQEAIERLFVHPPRRLAEHTEVDDPDPDLPACGVGVTTILSF